MSEQVELTKREAILRSAFIIFTEKGYHAAKVSDVAELAKVGKGTVYEYFSSKEDLLRGVIEEGIKYYMKELTESIKGPILPWEKIKKMIRRHAEILRENQNISQLIFHNFGIVTEEFHQFLISQRQVFIEMLKDIIQEGITSGELKPMRTEVAARIILGSMVSIQFETGCLDEASVEEMIKTLANGMMKI
ncbi:TetR/AcrR family transcriptional regulator [Tepidibacillus sp. HK-1]|uniref:TetR/AcrR family transcriptional regulator n=1 Tax=Tepidibacillus sp. HK-1 TaxID=1883407 RepID=UPI000852D088|nr:TetR/AcrR family transcriptional regulator [Tepidibacillus sp. HK-1]GBF11837.1 fatty acid metabolism regulator protein [Tepidibacillus sp. HK-1]